jgi:hypothetical protein
VRDPPPKVGTSNRAEHGKEEAEEEAGKRRIL